jgi:hypothetical protein
MAKRNRNTNSKSRGKGSKKGRGKGRGKHYDPYLHIQDVASKGRVSRVMGWKTGRAHHCLSKLEWLFFWILEWSHVVVDIREQYPLDLEETLAIAKTIGISHPVNSKTKEPREITTDFLVTIKTRRGPVDQARTIKYVRDLSSNRVMEKFEIERVYWTSREIDWGIVTENDIDLIVASNVELVHYYRGANMLSPLSKAKIRRIETTITTRVTSECLSLRDLTNDCDEEFGLQPGTSAKVVLHLIANRRWKIDMRTPIQLPKRLVLV